MHKTVALGRVLPRKMFSASHNVRMWSVQAYPERFL